MTRSEGDEAYERHVLEKPIAARDRPRPDHYTLAVHAYWRHGLLDSVESGRRRRVVVGGYRTGAHLRVEAPLPVEKFTIARLYGPEAEILVPYDAAVALRKGDGPVTTDVELVSARAELPVRSYRLRFDERLAFRLGSLTFVAQYVLHEGRRRTRWDWLIPSFWPW